MYRGRHFIRECIYVCGNYMDADIYPVFQPAGKRRARCKPTSAIQEKLNQRNAEKKITRLAHARGCIHKSKRDPPRKRWADPSHLYGAGGPLRGVSPQRSS